MCFCLSMLYPGTEKLKYTKLQYILPLILKGCEILSVAPTEERWLYLQYNSEKIWASRRLNNRTKE